ncbi:MAG: PIN domain-containing protein [Acidobacteria bacterium]|nr:PIN domain-containing protein [Acidobacteriota bacterium]
MNYLIDTSVLVRALHTIDPASAVARQSLSALFRRQDSLYILPQIVAEFWVVATRPETDNGLGHTPAQTARWLTRFRASFNLQYETAAVYQQWRKLLGDYQVKGKQAHDARLVAAAQAHRFDAILTFNGKHFQRYPDVTVVHPADIAGS